MSHGQPNPRKQPKRQAASAAPTTALATGTATADEGRYERAYRDRTRRVGAVEEHAGDVLAELADRGILGEASVGAFDLDSEAESTALTPDAAVDAWAVTETVDPETERRTGHIKLSKHTDDHDLTLHVRPEQGEAYALVSPTGDEETFAIDPTTEAVKLRSSADCEDFCDCSTEVCTPWWSTKTLMYVYNYDCFRENRARCQCYVESKECGCDPLIGC
jgi:hypothetical protein